MGEIIVRNINKIIIVASSWLFVLLYQGCTVIQTSNYYFTRHQWTSFCNEEMGVFLLSKKINK